MKKSGKNKQRDLRAYRNKAQTLKRKTKLLNLPCHLCGKKIDTTLPFLDPHAFTADHIIPLAKGGHVLGELKPAHRICNSKRQTKPINKTQQQPTKQINKPKTKYQW